MFPVRGTLVQGSQAIWIQYQSKNALFLHYQERIRTRVLMRLTLQKNIRLLWRITENHDFVNAWITPLGNS